MQVRHPISLILCGQVAVFERLDQNLQFSYTSTIVAAGVAVMTSSGEGVNITVNAKINATDEDR